jgi:predicted small lipoprotein YifL
MKFKTIFLLFLALILMSGPIGCGHKGPPTPPKDSTEQKITEKPA